MKTLVGVQLNKHKQVQNSVIKFTIPLGDHV